MLEKLTLIGPMGYPLLFFSLIGLALIVERTFFFCKLKNLDSCPILNELAKLLKKNKNQPKAIREEIVAFSLVDKKRSFDFGIKFLRIIAVISPMLGLLGTVIGIIQSFKIISEHDGPVYPALIADGLWTAMLTTACGLIIALPCLFAAFLFARMAEKRISLYQRELNKMSLKFDGVDL